MRAGIYVRVSSEEQVDGFSLDAQRRACRDACASRGWEVASEYVDEGKSARGDTISKRPAFRRMMEDAEAGLLEVVVVHKLDRFARNIRVTFEYLEFLARHSVKFMTVAQDVDYTKPDGRLFMGMLATLAQYYSDNLSQETKKGKAERKAQGLYNGHLPFGMIKGEGGAPEPDPATIDGLRLAFRLAADCLCDRDIAVRLNTAGYRTSGTHGSNPFTKDTVRTLLQNRFYLGELPGTRPTGAAPVRHAPVIEQTLWGAAQEARERRTISPRSTVPRTATTYSLSGLALCGQCGSHIHIEPGRGRPRVLCWGRRQGRGCTASSTQLAGLETQIGVFLATFIIPPDYQERLMAFVAQEPQEAVPSTDHRRRLQMRLDRLKDLYMMGDLSKEAYVAERERLKRELGALNVRDRGRHTQLAALAALLANVAAGWNAAHSEQRNRMARLLFDEVVINNKQVEAVKPRPELAPFFLLNQETQAGVSHMYGTSGPDERLLRVNHSA
jgi:DNA invertase Pin-like site-specific DNA recombinase